MVYALYIASFAGAAALLLMMPRQGFNPAKFGGLLGALALGGAWLWFAGAVKEDASGLPSGSMPYYYVFSALAIAAAVRVITHKKPVYSALWFVMVVLSSAGLFLVLSAEFIAFAMVIIYGGAILVTYVFVIMLAAQAGADADEEVGATYDIVAREPFWGVTAGFLLLSLLLTVAFPQDGFVHNDAAASPSDAVLIETVLPNRSEQRMAARYEVDDESPAAVHARGEAGRVKNYERVGVDLFESHPLGLELAGVILLVSLVGAVVIAKQPGEVPENPIINE